MPRFLQAIALVFICNLGQCYSCTNVTLNCTSMVSNFPCHELACLKFHWSVMMPYAYLLEGDGNKTTPYGILIGWFSNYFEPFSLNRILTQPGSYTSVTVGEIAS